MNALQTIPGSDAGLKFRGYVFQIDYAIFCWKNLNENETMLLEYGEDIAVRDEYDNYFLTQLKHVEESATLRSQHVLKTLVHAVSLIQQVTNIKYNYVTTANIGTENDVKYSLIESWGNLQKMATIPSNNSELLEIQKVLGMICY